MRLKEDQSSWQSSGVKRRDFRHDASQPIDVAPHRPKKAKAKWCKGRVGIEHEWENKVPPNDNPKFRKMDICKNCGRQSYTNVKYYCRAHKVWDEHVYWNDDHTH